MIRVKDPKHVAEEQFHADQVSTALLTSLQGQQHQLGGTYSPSSPEVLLSQPQMLNGSKTFM